jgi:hypothetical protein
MADLTEVFGVAPETVAAQVQCEQANLLRAQAQRGQAQRESHGCPNTSGASGPVSVAADGIAWPPGFAGALARFIYRRAHRPVPEVAIVGALGLLAGVCGREWCIPGSGLNIYVVLVARSGIGKEAMHSGISNLVSTARQKYDRADGFVTFDDFASGPALVKHVLGYPRSVNVAGELGHKFAAMAKGTESAMTTLRRQLTNLYSKSGRGNVAGGIAYSNQESNVASIEGAAFSLIGETTPGVFFESIHRGMMEDGFMSRFTVIEYTGERPRRNRNRIETPDPQLVDWLVAMMRQADLLAAKGEFQDVDYEPDAAALFDVFEDECDEQINAAQDDEAHRQMWNRAALKANRIAALLAVGDQYLFPRVTAVHVDWAIGLVRHDIAVFTKRLRSGDVGEGSDGGRERRLLELCREYLTMQELPSWAKKYEDAHKIGVVPHSYLSQKTQRLAMFENHPRGHSAALSIAISAAIDNGRLHVMTARGLELRGLAARGKMYVIADIDPH